MSKYTAGEIAKLCPADPIFQRIAVMDDNRLNFFLDKRNTLREEQNRGLVFDILCFHCGGEDFS